MESRGEDEENYRLGRNKVAAPFTLTPKTIRRGAPVPRQSESLASWTEVDLRHLFTAGQIRSRRKKPNHNKAYGHGGSIQNNGSNLHNSVPKGRENRGGGKLGGIDSILLDVRD